MLLNPNDAAAQVVPVTIMYGLGWFVHCTHGGGVDGGGEGGGGVGGGDEGGGEVGGGEGGGGEVGGGEGGGGAAGDDGGAAGGDGGGKGDGTAMTPQISISSEQPALQPPTSSSTVQSLAPASKQKPSASAKSFLLWALQSDPTHTEQPALLNIQKVESWVSEQHRTWPRAAGHGQHIRKCAMGLMRCKRTPCSSSTSLKLNVSEQPPNSPHTTGRCNSEPSRIMLGESPISLSVEEEMPVPTATGKPKVQD